MPNIDLEKNLSSKIPVSRRRLLTGAAGLGGVYALDRLLPKNAEAGNGWQGYFKNLIVSEQEAAQRKVPYIRQQFAVLSGAGQPTDLFVLRGVTDYGLGDVGIYRSKLVGNEYSQFEPMSLLPLKTTYKAWAGYADRGLVTVAVGASQKPRINIDKGALAISYNEGKNWYHHIFDGTGFFTDIKPIDSSGGLFLLDIPNSIVGPRAHLLSLNLDYPQITPRVTPIEGFAGPIQSLAIIESSGKLSAGDVVTVYTVEESFKFRKNSLDVTTGKVLNVEDINYPPGGSSTIMNVYKENGITQGLIMVNWFSQQVFSYFDVQKNEGVLFDANDWKSSFPSAKNVYVIDAVKVGNKFFVAGVLSINGGQYGYLGVLENGVFQPIYTSDVTVGFIKFGMYQVNGTQVLDLFMDPIGKRIVSASGGEGVWASRGLDTTVPKEPVKEEGAFVPLVQDHS